MIPKKFKLFAQEWEVVLMDDPTNGDLLGKTEYDKRVINLYKQCQGIEIKEKTMEATFYHELLHAILYMGSFNAENNEHFVDVVSGLLHQFEETKK